MKLNAVIVVLSVETLVCASQPSPITIQAESGRLVAPTTVSTTRPGFEGSGYVEGFANEAGSLELAVNAPTAGIYDLQIRYGADSSKGYTLTVNDDGCDGVFPPSPNGFSIFDAGKIELVQGTNRIVIGRGWGHYAIDWLRVTPAERYPDPQPIAPTLVNPDASPEAQALMQQLAEQYGHATLSGVIKQADLDYVLKNTGQTPAIMGGDLMDYSPSRRARGADPHDETERLIAAHAAGQVITLSWHWNAPRDLIDEPHHIDEHGNAVDASWYFGFYTRASRFDFTSALDDPNSEARHLLEHDIDTIAVELEKLRAAHVPVLWRPLHEADGGWFWWGARGPENYKRLWRFVYDRLAHHHRLDNLVWVFTWNDPAWYPGDDVVDLVGIDAYPSTVGDTLSTHWNAAFRAFDGRKLVALSEYGGVPDLPAMHRLGERWAYFVSWTGPQGPQKNAVDDLVRIYRFDGTRTLTRPAPATRP